MEQLAPIEIDPKTFLKQNCSLPALPDVVGKIQKVVTEDNVDMGEIVESISSDPALVAQILKVANSSYYSLPSEVSNIRFAIAFLGVNEIYRMVLSLSVINAISIDNKEELSRFWFHSFYTALSVKCITKNYAPNMSPDELWSASILHDIGKLVYLKFFPDHYIAVKKLCEDDGCLFSEAERHYGLPSSAFMGTLLCDHWGLPRAISEACQFHTLMDLSALKDTDPSTEFRKVICVANLATVLASENLSEDKKLEISGAVMQALHCSESALVVLMGDIYDLKIQVEEFMSRLK